VSWTKWLVFIGPLVDIVLYQLFGPSFSSTLEKVSQSEKPPFVRNFSGMEAAYQFFLGKDWLELRLFVCISRLFPCPDELVACHEEETSNKKKSEVTTALSSNKLVFSVTFQRPLDVIPSSFAGEIASNHLDLSSLVSTFMQPCHHVLFRVSKEGPIRLFVCGFVCLAIST